MRFTPQMHITCLHIMPKFQCSIQPDDKVISASYLYFYLPPAEKTTFTNVTPQRYEISLCAFHHRCTSHVCILCPNFNDPPTEMTKLLAQLTYISISPRLKNHRLLCNSTTVRDFTMHFTP